MIADHLQSPSFERRDGASGSRVYASVFNPGAIARSVDGGSTWTGGAPPLRRRSANALLETRRGALLSATGAGIYRSTDDGASWTATGTLGQHVSSLVAGRGRAYASVADASLWRSVDSGVTWARVDWPRVDNPRRFDSPAPFSPLFIVDGTESGNTVTAFAKDDRGRYWLGTRNGVLRLSIDGSDWRLSPTGLDGDISAVAVDSDGYLLAAVIGRGMFRARLP
jgi:photosystem II stability/assembly factor-like uncharacterized protein